MLLSIRFFIFLSVVSFSIIGSELREVSESRKRERITDLGREVSVGYESNNSQASLLSSGVVQKKGIAKTRDAFCVDKYTAARLGLIGYADVDYRFHPRRTVEQHYSTLLTTQARNIQEKFCEGLRIPMSLFEERKQLILQGKVGWQGVINVQTGAMVVHKHVEQDKASCFSLSVIQGQDEVSDLIGRQYIMLLKKLAFKTHKALVVLLATQRDLLQEKLDSLTDDRLKQLSLLEHISQSWSKAVFDVELCWQKLDAQEQQFLLGQVRTPINYIQDIEKHKACYAASLANYDMRSAWTIRNIVQDFHDTTLTTQQRQARAHHRHEEGPTAEEIRIYEEERFGK